MHNVSSDYLKPFQWVSAGWVHILLHLFVSLKLDLNHNCSLEWETEPLGQQQGSLSNQPKFVFNINKGIKTKSVNSIFEPLHIFAIAGLSAHLGGLIYYIFF